MLEKLKTKSTRVKGISFHPYRPWILASLHTGTIQLWDYRIKTMLDKFEDHRGPVRGVCFHRKQAIFVSGGDDNLIKVWNYKERRKLFDLKGHIDYIRTVFFHDEHPWIISSSDDQTARIWNWQSRQLLVSLAGHSNYVMCAQFHPTKNLVATCSMDQTIRVWDTSNLLKKNISPPQSTFEEKLRTINRPDLFSIGDVVVIHILEGHDSAVNWVDFHKTLPLLISASDDKLIKIWKITEDKAIHFDTLRGHHKNVSSVIFHPSKDLLISDSEDKSIRFWNLNSRICVDTSKVENDRFWCLAAHPSNNLIAAGHDNGMVVFKMEKERPAFCVAADAMFYMYKNTIKRLNLSTNKDEKVYTRTSNKGTVEKMIYNPDAKAIILKVCNKNLKEEYSYALLKLSGNESEKYKLALDVVWISRNRYVVLDRSNTLVVKNLDCEVTKRIPISGGETLYYYGLGCVIIKDVENLTILDIQQNKKIVSKRFVSLKSVIWRNDSKYMALLCSKCIHIVDKQLNSVTSIRENISIKSGIWDENVFVYTTNHHIKYLLLNGDFGIIRTLEFPVYLAKIFNGKLFCIDRNTNIRIVQIDSTEYKFKLALISKRFDLVLNMIRTTKLVGQSIISYLEQKGYPDIALHFVSDDKSKFSLALKCGNLPVALIAARNLDNGKCWEQLSNVALSFGNLEIVELCYQRMQSFDQLTFFYLLTGQTEKLKKISKILQIRGDFSLQFQTAILTNSVTDQLNILEKCQQLPSAYLLATNKKLSSQRENLANALESNVVEKINALQHFYNFPCLPQVVCEGNSNWPMLNSDKNIFDFSMKEMIFKPNGEDGVEQQVEASWETDSNDSINVSLRDGTEPDSTNDGFHTPLSQDEDEKTTEDEGWGEEDIDIAQDDLISSEGQKDFKKILLGKYKREILSKTLDLYQLVSMGCVEKAFSVMEEKYGITNFTGYEKIFQEIYIKSQMFFTPGIAFPDIGVFNTLENDTNKIEPKYTIESINRKLKSAFNFKKFNEAIDTFRKILHVVPFVQIENKNDVRCLKKIISKCREYILGLSIELERRNVSKKEGHVARALQLAALSTHCEYEPSHMLLALKVAMHSTYKAGNYTSSGDFAQKYLSFGPSKDSAEPASKILTVSKKKNYNNVQVDYDNLNPFNICAQSYVPIYTGTESVKCNFCNALFCKEFESSLCPIDNLCLIGKDCPTFSK